MFTGIVEACVPVRSWEPCGGGGRLVLPAPQQPLGVPWGAAAGESISVSGCCLTVAGFRDPASGRELEPGAEGRAAADLVFELSAETLQRTWLGELESGRAVNLERSLRVGDRLGGHLVSGHIDGLATICSVRDSGDGCSLLEVEVGTGLERYLIEKGSVTLDGVSLTVVEPHERRFSVAVIPATLSITSLGNACTGQRVNVEADAIGKWVERLFPGAGAPGEPAG